MVECYKELAFLTQIVWFNLYQFESNFPKIPLASNKNWIESY